MASKANASLGLTGAAILAWLFSLIWDFIGAHWLIIAIGGAVIGVVLVFKKVVSDLEDMKSEETWLAALQKKYKNKEVVERILNREYWEGQTEEQLRDALGEPDDKDERKTKVRHTQIWKYGHIHSNRYRLRITLKNGLVTGWDEKG